MRPAFLRCLVQKPLLIAVVIAVMAASAHAQKCCKPELHQESGLSIASFQGEGGAIRVYLPDDMAAGDTISGTVVGGLQAQPGQTPGESGELTGYVVEVEGQPTPSDGKTTFHVPAAARQVMLVLRNKGGQELARQAVPVLAAGQAGAGTACTHHDIFMSPGHDIFLLPAIGQAGRPLGICGPFDGNLGNTTVTIGGQAARALAESPRQAIFQAPANAAGRQALELSENGRQVKGQLQLVRVSLSAPKRVLQRGESTTLTVTVTGLVGLPQTLPLELVNRSTNVVTLEGGESQVVPISPQLNSDELTITRTVTGVQPGTYDIRAQVKIESAPGSSAPAGGSKPPVTATGPGQSSAPAAGSAPESGPQVATTPGSESPVDKAGKGGDTSTFCLPGSVGKPTGKPGSERPLLCRGTIDFQVLGIASDQADLRFAISPGEAGDAGEKLAPGTCGWGDTASPAGMPSQLSYGMMAADPLSVHRASVIEHCLSDSNCVVALCAVHYKSGSAGWSGPDVWLVDGQKIGVMFPKF